MKESQQEIYTIKQICDDADTAILSQPDFHITMINIFNNSILENTVTITRGLEYTIKNQMESPELKTYNNLKLIIQNMSLKRIGEREREDQ